MELIRVPLQICACNCGRCWWRIGNSQSGLLFLVDLIQIVHKFIPIVCHIFIVISSKNNSAYVILICRWLFVVSWILMRSKRKMTMNRHSDHPRIIPSLTPSIDTSYVSSNIQAPFFQSPMKFKSSFLRYLKIDSNIPSEYAFVQPQHSDRLEKKIDS